MNFKRWNSELESRARNEYHRILAAFIGAMLASHGDVQAMDHVQFEQRGTVRNISGRVLVSAQDGGLLLEGQDGQVWTLTPDAIHEHQRDDIPFTLLARDELGRRLLSELPAGFAIHTTRHYLICYNTSRVYAEWCGSLYERLHGAFFNFWKHKGIELREPEVLVALIFRDQRSYSDYARVELGEAATAVVGYYSLATNRITTFDLTGIGGLGKPGERSGSVRQIRRILGRPFAEPTVATVIHEATHQLSFNSGLQRRFADNPLWLSEGLAIYFESPDVSSQRGWRKIGAIHPSRLAAFQRFRARRPENAMLTLLTDDQRFRDTRQGSTAYAESWALCYHLLRQHPDGFVRYLQTIQQKPYLQTDSAALRVKEFEEAFGQDWRQLDAELLRSVDDWR